MSGLIGKIDLSSVTEDIEVVSSELYSSTNKICGTACLLAFIITMILNLDTFSGLFVYFVYVMVGTVHTIIELKYATSYVKIITNNIFILIKRGKAILCPVGEPVVEVHESEGRNNFWIKTTSANEVKLIIKDSSGTTYIYVDDSDHKLRNLCEKRNIHLNN